MVKEKGNLKYDFVRRCTTLTGAVLKKKTGPSFYEKSLAHLVSSFTSSSFALDKTVFLSYCLIAVVFFLKTNEIEIDRVGFVGFKHSEMILSVVFFLNMILSVYVILLWFHLHQTYRLIFRCVSIDVQELYPLFTANYMIGFSSFVFTVKSTYFFRRTWVNSVRKFIVFTIVVFYITSPFVFTVFSPLLFGSSVFVDFLNKYTLRIVSGIGILLLASEAYILYFGEAMRKKH